MLFLFAASFQVTQVGKHLFPLKSNQTTFIEIKC